MKCGQALGDTTESQWQEFGGSLCFETLCVGPGALVTHWPSAASTSAMTGNLEEVLPLVSRFSDSTWIEKLLY